ADQGQVAVGVEHPLVAGPEPALGEGRRVGLRVVRVAVDDARTADHHLAYQVLCQELAGFAEDADLDAGFLPDRPRPPVLRRKWGGTTTVPPDLSVAMTEAISPWMWKSGMTQSATSSAPSR